MRLERRKGKTSSNLLGYPKTVVVQRYGGKSYGAVNLHPSEEFLQQSASSKISTIEEFCKLY